MIIFNHYFIFMIILFGHSINILKMYLSSLFSFSCFYSNQSMMLLILYQVTYLIFLNYEVFINLNYFFVIQLIHLHFYHNFNDVQLLMILIFVNNFISIHYYFNHKYCYLFLYSQILILMIFLIQNLLIFYLNFFQFDSFYEYQPIMFIFIIMLS